MSVILDPTDERVPVTRQITPRTGKLSGVIGLMDIRKPRGNILLDELEMLLAAPVPGRRDPPLREADLHQAGAIRGPPEDPRRVRLSGRSPGRLRLMHDVQSARHCMVRDPGASRRHHRLQRVR